MYQSFLFFMIFFLCPICTLLQAHKETKPAAVKEEITKGPFYLTADSFIYKRPSTFIAKENVLFSDGSLIMLTANHVEYDDFLRNLKSLSKLRFYNISGDIIHAEKAFINLQSEQAFFDDVYMLSHHDERIAAQRIQIKGDKHQSVDYGVYTPCAYSCSQCAPTWSIKAKSIHRNLEKGEITYKDAFMTFFDVPILYLPYFSHSDPSVKRKTGFLNPVLGYGNSTGIIVGSPFYWEISSNTDWTITPMLLSKSGSFLTTQFRHWFEKGFLIIDPTFSYTDSTKDQAKSGRFTKKYRWSLFVDGQYRLNQNWRINTHIQRASDQTYLRRFPFLDPKRYSVEPILTSQVNVDAFYGQNYAYLGGYAFQDLREEAAKDQTPIIAPLIKMHYQSYKGLWGGYITNDAQILNVHRKYSSRVSRLSNDFNVNFNEILASGFNVYMSAGAIVNAYNLSNFVGNKKTINSNYMRALPRLYMKGSYPLIKSLSTAKLIVSPIISTVVSPNISKNPYIPNEDSQDFELSASNIMLPSRFPGKDIFDSGTRLNYGIEVKLFEKGAQRLNIFLAQSYSFSMRDIYPTNSGVRKGFSDYVGRLKFHFWNESSLAYSFRLQPNNFKPRLSQVTFATGTKKLRFSADYIYSTHMFFNQLIESRHQIITSFKAKPIQHLKVEGSLSYQFSNTPGVLEGKASIGYEDDCFGVDLTAQKSYYRDRDLKPQTLYFLTFNFKHLGSFTTNPFQTDIDDENHFSFSKMREKSYQ